MTAEEIEEGRVHRSRGDAGGREEEGDAAKMDPNGTHCSQRQMGVDGGGWRAWCGKRGTRAPPKILKREK